MNKNVLVSGAARGIGKGIATAFANLGCQVMVSDIDEIKGKELEQGFPNIHFVKADMSQEAEIVNLFQQIGERFTSLDILINNVGISLFKPLLDLTLNEWDSVINTNLRSAFLCAREFARIHPPKSYGRIINLSSTRHLMSEPNAEAYAASKGGLVSLTHALAVSLQSEDFTVNCISPGWIHTGEPQLLSKLDHQQHLSKRVGTPDDIARFCVFLCQPENGFITGQNFYVDGGMTKKMMYDE